MLCYYQYGRPQASVQQSFESNINDNTALVCSLTDQQRENAYAESEMILLLLSSTIEHKINYSKKKKKGWHNMMKNLNVNSTHPLTK